MSTLSSPQLRASYEQSRPPQAVPTSHGPQDQGCRTCPFPATIELRAVSTPSGRPREPQPTVPGVQDVSTLSPSRLPPQTTNKLRPSGRDTGPRTTSCDPNRLSPQATSSFDPQGLRAVTCPRATTPVLRPLQATYCELCYLQPTFGVPHSSLRARQVLRFLSCLPRTAHVP